MRLIVEWNVSANMFYLLKNLLLVILVISKLKCNNLIFNEIMILNISYVCLHTFSLYQESPDPDPERRTPHFWYRSQPPKEQDYPSINPLATLGLEPDIWTVLLYQLDMREKIKRDSDHGTTIWATKAFIITAAISRMHPFFFVFWLFFLNREINLSETYFQVLSLSHAS
jgi:hypothetical protein